MDRLVELGALDVEMIDQGIAALMPDVVGVDDIARAVEGADVRVGPAVGRDDDSVWVLGPRTVTVAGLSIVPAGGPIRSATLQLADSSAFGTGLHPTTALCLEAIRDVIDERRPERMLDIGTGSGVLALAALTMGVPHVVGIDVDAVAIAAAAANARVNGLTKRCRLVRGDERCLHGPWPLVVANILAAPLIEMAPAVVRLVAHDGRLVLSGIPEGVLSEVEQAYVRLGMHRVRTAARAGWTMVVLRTTW